MSVSTALVTQYYQGILRQTPSTATVNQLANSADLSSLTNTLLGMADTAVDPILRLYQAAFGRVPDTTGLTNMVGVYANNVQHTGTLTLAQMAGQFTGSPEFINLYGTQTTNHASNTAFVSALYVNVLNRAMVGTEGDAWIALLDAGGSRNTTLTGFSESPEFITATNGAVDNFLTAAGALTNSYASNLFYYGSATAANTQTLTINTDTYTGNAGYNVFNAGLTNGGSGNTMYNTLQNSDSITGGTGVNTLNVTTTGTETITPVSLNKIQNISISNAGAGTLDLTNAPQIVNVTVHDTAGSETVNNIQSATTNFAVSNVANAVAFDVANAALLGTSDVAVLTVKGVAGGTNNSITMDAGYETLTINSVNYSATNTSNVIQTGFAGNIILQDLGQASGGAVANTLAGAASATTVISSTNVNASALTGTLVTALGGSATTIVGGNGNTTITGGAAADSVTFGSGTDLFIAASLAAISADTTIIGGGGTDTLQFTGLVNSTTADASFHSVTGFEALQLGNIETNTIGLSTKSFVNGGTIIGGTGADTIIAYGNVTASGTVNGGLGNDILSFNNTAGGTFTILNVESVATSNAGSVADSITIGTSGAAVSVELGSGTDTVTLATGTLTTLTVSNVETVTANATTGNEIILAQGAVSTTVNGGSAALYVNGASNTSSNSILFGAGADTLLLAGLSNLSGEATVVGAGGTDTLAFSAVVDATGADGNFAKVATMETLQLSSAGSDGTNNIGLSSNFFGSFTQVIGGTAADVIGVYGTTVASSTAATVNGGLGNDILSLFNTAGGTFTILNVESVATSNAGSVADSITIGTSGAAVSVELGSGTDTVTLATGTLTTLTVSNVETVTANATTGNEIILAQGAVSTTVNGGSAALYVNGASNTSSNSILFGAGADTLLLAGLSNLSGEATVVGAGGTDTLAFSALVFNTGADGNFAKVATMETLQLGNIETNTIGLSSNFFGSFNQVIGGTGDDTIGVYGTTVSAATINGGGGADSLALFNTGGGTFSLLGVNTVTSTSAGSIADSVTYLQEAGTLTSGGSITLGAGVDSVTNLNTSGATFTTFSGVESFTGNYGVEKITLGGGTAATTIYGGGGADIITLGSNLNTTSVSQGGNIGSGSMSIVGNVLTAAETVAIIGAGLYITTSVETVNVSSGVAASIAANLNLGTGNATFAYNLASGNTAAFTLTTAGTTAYTSVLSVNASTGDQTITMTAIGGKVTSYDLIQAGGGYDNITLAISAATGVVNETIAINLANEATGYNTADSFVAANFGLSTGTDTINLFGATLKNANGASIVLNQDTVSASGLGNTNVFTTGDGVGTFITGSSTILANLASTTTQTGVIFELVGTVATADFTTQAGINTGAAFIAATIGTSGTVSGQNAIIVIADTGSAHSALYQFTENGTASGISTSELKLIGVVNGVLTTTNFS